MGEIRTPFERTGSSPSAPPRSRAGSCPAPADPDRLLAATYGPAWRTPDPAFKFETPASTSKRLNDWFRGTSVNRAEWDRKYQRLRRNNRAAPPDVLAGSRCGTSRTWHWRSTSAAVAGQRAVLRPPWAADAGAGLLAAGVRAGAAGSRRRRAAAGVRGDEPARDPARAVATAPGSAPRRAGAWCSPATSWTPYPGPGGENLWRFLQVALTGGGRAYLDFLVVADRRGPLGTAQPAAARSTPTRSRRRRRARRPGGDPQAIDSDRMGLPKKRRDTFYERRQACRMVIEWAG